MSAYEGMSSIEQVANKHDTTGNAIIWTSSTLRLFTNRELEISFSPSFSQNVLGQVIFGGRGSKSEAEGGSWLFKCSKRCQ